MLGIFCNGGKSGSRLRFRALRPLGIAPPNNHDEHGKTYEKKENDQKISWGIARPGKP
jgi:hypothetical protein